jgi:hypothetical protein
MSTDAIKQNATAARLRGFCALPQRPVEPSSLEDAIVAPPIMIA